MSNDKEAKVEISREEVDRRFEMLLRELNGNQAHIKESLQRIEDTQGEQSKCMGSMQKLVEAHDRKLSLSGMAWRGFVAVMSLSAIVLGIVVTIKVF